VACRQCHGRNEDGGPGHQRRGTHNTVIVRAPLTRDDRVRFRGFEIMTTANLAADGRDP
jgi:hypothetical protein